MMNVILKVILNLILAALDKFGPEILKAIKNYIDKLIGGEPTKEERKALKKECIGVACAPTLKK